MALFAKVYPMVWSLAKGVRVEFDTWNLQQEGRGGGDAFRQKESPFDTLTHTHTGGWNRRQAIVIGSSHISLTSGSSS